MNYTSEHKHEFVVEEIDQEWETRGHHEYEQWNVVILTYRQTCKGCDYNYVWRTEITEDEYNGNIE